MVSVEKSIRDAIARSGDNSTEVRNTIYLAAREAIEKLPREHAEPAMHELFEAVKTIETEFAKQELAQAQPQDRSPEQAPRPVYQQPVKRSKQRRSFRPVLKRLPRVPIPWKFVLVLVALLAAMAFSVQLLLQQFENAGLLSGTVQEKPSDRSTESAGEDGLVPLFSYPGRSDITKLATRPDGKGQLKPANGDDPDHSEVLLPSRVSIYSQDAVRFEPGRFYLLRLKLRMKPVGGKALVRVGFSLMRESSETSQNSRPFRSFLVHDGEITESTRREEGNVLVFSKLFEWRDLKKDIPLDDTDGLVRPIVIVRALNDNVRMWLNSLTIDAI